MMIMNKSKTILNGVIAVSMLSAALISSPAVADKYYTIKDGILEKPSNYREWVYVGTPVTPNDMNDGKAPFPEFHNVYIDPDSWAQWKARGTLPDGAILVKELVSVGSKAAVSGKGYFMGEFIGLEATIKSKKHFPNEPGNWAYYSFTTPDHKSLNSSANKFPTEACNQCHQVSAATDWVFTQYYPVLRASKGMGHDGTQ